jgi:ABC-type xylose transport system permease subunit
MNQLFKRMKNPTPVFFKKLRNISLVMGAVATGLLTAPIALPVFVVTFAGYLLVGSTIAAGVSQLPVENTDVLNDEENKPV